MLARMKPTDSPTPTGTQWWKSAVLYELYVRAFRDANGDGHGDLRGVIERLDYVRDLGVDVVWLLPISPSPLRDDGYDVSDYYGIHGDYGDLDDFRALIEAAHARGLKVITDLVINHTSSDHPWFQGSRRRHDGKDDWYVWSDDPQRYADARIIFTDSERSNWTYDEVRGQYYWHRFFHHQPDLNYDHAEVRQAVKDVVRYWLELGIDGFRLDAIPYLYEREGTNCENLPETHAYLKELRAFIDEVKPGAFLLGEVNQWPDDTLPYFGNGFDEMPLLFHFPVMPRLWKALAQGDATPIQWILERTPAIPPSCQWVVFLRNHDELTLEMVTDEERAFMYAHYAPEPAMRLNVGIRRRLAPLCDFDRRRIELMHSLLMTLPGTPILYYGDEIGMGDDITLPDRNGVRTPMQWDDTPGAGFSEAATTYAPLLRGRSSPQHVNVAAAQADPDSLLHWVRRLIAQRRRHPALGAGSFAMLPSPQPELALFLSLSHDDAVLAVHNLSDRQVRCDAAVAALAGRTLRLEFGAQLGSTTPLAATSSADALPIDLAPYGYAWWSPSPGDGST
ncbi:MAG: maltose alpha-D-glucosyltransferase [Nocardiopsis sp. BM-2018]|nr:MAG: maltose alpha-D-glucosyltransferase [Nocardiopsis sp. BM-2018]